MKEEIEVMFPQTKEHCRWPANHQKPGEKPGNGFFPKALLPTAVRQ